MSEKIVNETFEMESVGDSPDKNENQDFSSGIQTICSKNSDFENVAAEEVSENWADFENFDLHVENEPSINDGRNDYEAFFADGDDYDDIFYPGNKNGKSIVAAPCPFDQELYLRVTTDYVTELSYSDCASTDDDTDDEEKYNAKLHFYGQEWNVNSRTNTCCSGSELYVKTPVESLYLHNDEASGIPEVTKVKERKEIPSGRFGHWLRKKWKSLNCFRCCKY